MASEQQPFVPASRDDAEAAFRLPIGAASPLWLAFGAAAAGASAWWWMTRWAREGAAVAVETFRPPEPTSFAAEDVEEAVEATSNAAEAVAADAGLVIDPLVEAPVAVAAVPETPAAIAEAVTQAPSASVEATVETVAEASKAAADDLTRLVGVGPKLAAALAERGISRFEQIAAWQAKELDEIDKALSLKGRATREAWVSQARRLAAD